MPSHATPARRRAPQKHILSIDIGGSYVKLGLSNRSKVERFESGSALSARAAVKHIRKLTREWSYSFVSIGIPTIVIDGHVVREPQNLGCGWMGFDFPNAFACSTRVVNDAVMQALGAYKGGRMLFLGFGTALGAVLVHRRQIFPMELAYLPFSNRKPIQNYVGSEARRRLGVRRWSSNAQTVIRQMRRELDAEDVVVGGGNRAALGRLPTGVRLGEETDAFAGGFRVWRDSFHGL